MKVRFNLAALTRVEYSKEVEVPDDTPAHILDQMMYKLYEEVDESDYTEDYEYWERGHCYWDKINE